MVPNKPTGDEDFDAFWDLYPNKVNKKDAMKVWVKIEKTRPPLADLLAAIAQQAKSRKWREGFIMGPDRWLRGEHWNDELVGAPPAGKPAPKNLVEHFKRHDRERGVS